MEDFNIQDNILKVSYQYVLKNSFAAGEACGSGQILGDTLINCKEASLTNYRRTVKLPFKETKRILQD